MSDPLINPKCLRQLTFPPADGGGEKTYKSAPKIISLERDGAARLARGAHNPKVGSSNLPPAIKNFHPLNEQIFKTLWSIRNLRPGTQKTYSKALKYLSRNCDLNDTNKVEEYVFNLDAKNKYKNNLLNAYTHYCKANEILWERPTLRTEEYPVKIPTEERIDKIISATTLKYSIIFHLSKYGLRPDEISKITLRDLDLERRQLTVKTSKMGLRRTLTLKTQVIDLLKDYISRYEVTSVDQNLFPSSKSIRNRWNFYRKRAYRNFRDPELLKIRLYDLRHWYGTTEYLKCRDIFHVKYLMGNRNIQSTLFYVHIAKGLTNYSEDYACKIAKNLEEGAKLVESGFEYVTTFERAMLFRKRK